MASFIFVADAGMSPVALDRPGTGTLLAGGEGVAGESTGF